MKTENLKDLSDAEIHERLLKLPFIFAKHIDHQKAITIIYHGSLREFYLVSKFVDNNFPFSLYYTKYGLWAITEFIAHFWAFINVHSTIKQAMERDIL